MELSQHGFLEELLAPRRDSTWSSTTTTFSSHGVSDQFFPSSWAFDSFEENPVLAISSSSSNPSSFLGFSTLLHDKADQPNSDQSCPFTSTAHGDQATDQDYPFGVLNINDHTTPLIPAPQEDYPPNNIVEDDQEFGFINTNLGSESQKGCFEESKSASNSCKVEIIMDHQQEQQQQQQQVCSEIVVLPGFNMGVCGEKKGRPRKLEGQPSKNLMAERRRRKRLNDRLSMLRSIVPKISKMDRTSILGDTIDYMKELLERISKLQEEDTEDSTNEQINLLGISKEVKPSEVLVRNSPKFDVDRRETDTRIDICCAAKPGLLLSTVNTLEALGVEIQQCVISCFNDFSMQASCSEGAQERTLISCEDIKQAIFRNAGYGGRCL